MIVLDENISGKMVVDMLKAWCKGNVTSVNKLRAETVVKDDAIPTILKTVKQPTFITTNVSDFWRKMPADASYCIICFDLPNEQIVEISHRLRHLLRVKEFKTKTARMGKIARVKHNQIDYYEAGSNIICSLHKPKEHERKNP